MWAHAEARGGMTPEYLTPEQCAERLCVNPKTVYAQIHSGRLPAIKMGRIYRVNAALIDERLAYHPAVAAGRSGEVMRPAKAAGEFARRVRGIDSANSTPTDGSAA
jgi:excisionase family DNA binding protein